MSSLVNYIPAPTGRDIKLAVLGTAAAIAIGVFVSFGKLIAVGLLLALPIGLVVAVICFTNPTAGLMIYFNINFFVLGLSRFLPEAPYGMLVDLLLIFIFIGILFTEKRTGRGRLNHPIVYLVLAWFAYTILLFFNTLAPSQVAWFFAIRGLSLYWLMTLTAGIILIKEPKHVYWIVNCLLFWSLLGALWSFRQYYVGLLPGEQRWLNEVGAKTHLLFGTQFRAFSFYSDAGQFGASMAQVALYAGIMMIETKTLYKRVLYALLAMVCFWGFAIAGTRGPLFILFAGLPLYLLLRKNIPLLISGISVMVVAIGLLLFTRVGQGNYQILRMRSALNMEDPSLLIRINNQILLASYMADKPFGGGVGSGGDWGHRFAPDSFLGNVALDSWYVKIWVEGGMVGLAFHLISLIIISVIGYRNINRMRDSHLKSVIMALYSGFVGILVASYGNQLFGQHPIDAEMYLTMALFVICPQLDKALPESELDSASTHPPIHTMS